MPRADFMINYRLDCSNLCSDFKEDISFHFSLGFTALMKRFTGNRSTSMFFQGSNAGKFFQQNLHQSNGTVTGNDERAYQKELQARYTQTSVGSVSNMNSFANNGGDVSNLLVVLQGFQTVTSRSNVLLVAVGGIVSRNSFISLEFLLN